MKQRSTAIRVAAERKQKQLEEVQEAKEMLLREQRERIEAETRRNELLAEEAKRGVDRMKLKKLEEAKEKHIQERLRAEENIQRSKHDLLLEKKKLEDQISEKLKRANEIQSEREKVRLKFWLIDFILTLLLRRFWFPKFVLGKKASVETLFATSSNRLTKKLAALNSSQCTSTGGTKSSNFPALTFFIYSVIKLIPLSYSLLL